jgi:hypothetical protein
MSSYINLLLQKLFSSKKPSLVCKKTSIKTVIKENVQSSNSVVVLVPVINYIEPSTDELLRKLESLGYVVWRKYGFSSLEQCKCVMAQEALDAGFEHLFWINSDINFSINDVEKLINSEFSFITAPYSAKGWPSLTNQFKQKNVIFGLGGGIYEINYSSSGFTYTHKSLYENLIRELDLKKVKIMGEEYEIFPYFYPLIIENQYLDGDLSFCYRVRQSGLKIYSDTTIKIEHISKYSYSLDYKDNTILEKLNGIVLRRIS